MSEENSIIIFRELKLLLDFDLYMLHKCERVCKSWYNFLQKNSQYYHGKYPIKLYKENYIRDGCISDLLIQNSGIICGRIRDVRTTTWGM